MPANNGTFLGKELKSGNRTHAMRNESSQGITRSVLQWGVMRGLLVSADSAHADYFTFLGLVPG